MPSLRTALSLVLAAAVGAAGCDALFGPGDDGTPPRITELPRPLSAAERQVIDRSNDFAFDLLRETFARETDAPNLFLSPLSASMALGMTLNGAAGETFDAMRATLRFEGLSQDEINRAYSDLLDLLVGLDRRVELLVANSAWARHGLPFRPEFFSALQTWFDAEARELDFGDPAALAAINGWARDRTKGLIERVLEEIEPDHILFLLNAVYFKGDWTDRFSRSATRPAPFTLADGSQVQVERMNGRIRAGHRWVDGVEVGELPYGGQAFVMNVVMPPPGAALGDLLASLDADAWARLIQGLPEDYGAAGRIEVDLPKLDLEYEKELNDVLEALGMGIAFDTNRADFSRMIELAPPLNAYLDFVKQNTYLRVDEEGTEAAAVTTVGVSVISAPPSLIVDRPYLLVIRERLSGTILFMGAIGDPRHRGG